MSLPDRSIDYQKEAAASCWLDDWVRLGEGRHWGQGTDGGFYAQRPPDDGFCSQTGADLYYWECTRNELMRAIERQGRETP